ncbi:hypothetical protein BCR44DRAFT_1427925 [Catenaria anguillulae PL171]|uniref:Uncharacterized protein n=1 Tax=Catenaria anguillulae PL171 TaxID=765915 RepID=A0A1Y2I0B9_9FUNG|nr:hypothetical protein BCR44DRAFT_1427925 [Catenaria anguillulae PL171]
MRWGGWWGQIARVNRVGNITWSVQAWVSLGLGHGAARRGARVDGSGGVGTTKVCACDRVVSVVINKAHNDSGYPVDAETTNMPAVEWPSVIVWHAVSVQNGLVAWDSVSVRDNKVPAS